MFETLYLRHNYSVMVSQHPAPSTQHPAPSTQHPAFDLRSCKPRSKGDLIRHSILEYLIFFIASMSFMVASPIGVMAQWCGTDDEDIPEGSLNFTPCFDVEEVISEQQLVYLPINIHFFLDDYCEGDLAAAPYVTEDMSPERAWQLARKIADDFNQHVEIMNENQQSLNYQWNSTAHNVDPSSAQIIPFRLVLKDVRLHCDSDVQVIGGGGANPTSLSPYLENGYEVINIFFTNILGYSSNPSGYFTSISGQSIIGIESFESGVLFHEIGHFLSLPHTFENPGFCNDTWRAQWEWDHDCDLDIDATGVFCWNSEPTFEDLNACDSFEFCETHPCCEWVNQNNNFMSYSAWSNNPVYSAVTACQLDKMLTYLANNRCDYLLALDPECPPNSAVVSSLLQVTDCSFCLDLRGSMNATSYKLEFYELPGMTLVSSTGWIGNSPVNYCFNTAYHKPSGAWLNGLEPETDYLVVMQTQNECEEIITYEREITTPEDCPGTSVEPAITFTLAPNPFTSYLDVDYEIDTTRTVSVYAIHPIYGIQSGGERHEGTLGAGQYDFTFNTTAWASGTVYIVFVVDGDAWVAQVVKS